MIAAAADAAAASAGMSAHLAGKAAAEAGAIAAAASGVSAASTLAGDVIGGQLAFGADLLSQLVPRPFHHLANLAVAGLGSTSAGFTVGNTLGASVQHPALHPVFGFPAMRFACATFLSELFGLKPLMMTPLHFYNAVRGVVDSYFDTSLGMYVPANPSDFVDRLNTALDFPVDAGILPGIQQDLVQVTHRFPIIGTPSFLHYLHDITSMILDCLVGGHPVFPPDWHFPGLPLFDHSWWHPSTSSNSQTMSGRLYPRPGNSVTGGTFDNDQYASLRQDNNQSAINIFDTTIVAGPGADISNPSVVANPTTTLTNTQTGTQDQNPQPQQNLSVTTGNIDQSATNTQSQSQENPQIIDIRTNHNGIPTTIRPFEVLRTPLETITAAGNSELPIDVAVEDLSEVVGTVTLPQVGTYPLLASIAGELSINLPGTGHRVLQTLPDGRPNVVVPGVGSLVPEISCPVVVVNISGHGTASMFITASGVLTVELANIGAILVSSTATGGLSVTLPTAGNAAVTLPAAARLVVFVPGYGGAPLTISASGRLSVALLNIGSLPVTASATGALTTVVPGVGLVAIRGATRIPLPPPIDHVVLPRIGCFPLHTRPNGAIIVPIPGLGVFPVTANPNGNMQIATPLGPFDVTTLHSHTPVTALHPHPRTSVAALHPHTPISILHPHTPVATLQSQPAVTQPTALTVASPVVGGNLGVNAAATGRLAFSGPLNDIDIKADLRGNHNWVWGLSDAAVYFLQKLDVFRPTTMTPENFLYVVNQTILNAKLNVNWRTITPVHFIHALLGRLGNVVDLTPVTIESIGEHVANSLEGPFPPFSDILDHISEVITEKLENN
eukprot:Gregarina_sp_Poly_1__3679@NODE_2085_length_2713_cov_9_185563_g1345_i0_p1_GENE_NODE_2085_length_2713_cov_9_185563_g1345_i0NODE_2085_length_2713_cov_9_185563_g1345_i0_p1_ORF_typecomplete_len877_score75_09DUF2807/PF10988_8/1_5e04DUF2807/PF10988_8/0_13DUF2807/PF10988_8/60DUF2807/PF10988_8/1_4e03_NODE_2085_length_2713_cov_9_185563_g1345_i0822604